MVSLLSMGIKSIVNAFVYALKAFFSLLTWFLKAFGKALKLLFTILPVTSVFFVLLILLNIFVLCTGQLPAVLTAPSADNGSFDITGLFDPDRSSVIVNAMFGSLKLWWLQSMASCKGQASYILLIIITVLMFVPVMTVFLCISVFASFGNILFISVVIDAILYLLGALLGRSFIHQALGRYYRLFPEAGRKHEEKEYDKLLKKRNRMLDEEMKDRRRGRASDFYGDDEYDDYDGDDYEGSDYPEDDYYPEDDCEDDYYPEDECAADYDEDYDEEYEEDYDDYEDEEYIEDFEDDYDDPKSRRHGRDRIDSTHASGNGSTFDFFAGCNSRESVDKKYRSLVKLYHPDNMDGDTAALQEINVQYEKAKKSWSD